MDTEVHGNATATSNVARMSSYDHMLYARGFLISDHEPVNLPAHWFRASIGAWQFHYDPATPLIVNNDTLVFGHAVDLGAATSDLGAVAAALVSGAGQAYIDQLAGRFLIVRAVGDNLLIQQDATGLRAVYHTEAMYRFVAGSHQRLVATQVDAPRGYFDGAFLRNNNMQAHPGRKTQSVGVVRQLPNTELNSASRRTDRIFPRIAIEQCSVDDAARSLIAAANVQLGAIKTPLISSLSAGLDSRVTMALLRKALHRTKFFTYEIADQPHNDGNRHDRDGATELAAQFELDHQTLEVTALNDQAFEYVMNKNTSRTHGQHVAKAYWEKLPHEALHIRSNLFEIARCYYRNMGIDPKNVAAHAMRYIIANGRSFDLPTLDAFEEYVQMTDFKAALELGYDGLDLFYWEHRMGSWMTPILHESDIAHDTHVLINARSILTKLLGVPLPDRMSGAVFRRVIALSWPEISAVPINGQMVNLE